MQIVTFHDALNLLWQALNTVREFKSILAVEALKAIFLPLHGFSSASCLASIGGIAVLWKNKGIIFSGLSHLIGSSDVL